MKNKPIILVAGEPKSIFFEIFFKAIKIKKYKSPLILICCKKILLQEMKKNNSKKTLKIINIDKLKNININNNSINLINVELQKFANHKHQITLTQKYIHESFNIAFKLIRNGFTKKLINGPINKKTFLNKKFYGVTEYISENFKKKKIGMLIYNKKLSVCPLTTHLPIKLVPKKITKKLIEEKIEIINSFFKKNFKIKPKIAVTGLNPHCESILKFNEDENLISDAIKTKTKKKINVKGPYPADTIFLKENRSKFNVILGMYHDQVLGPFKTIFEYDAINITMGLPFLRATPDHGPNQQMVGKNQSNPQSLIKALEFLDNK
jgi:4-hydroxythreonine-4-phosphate dehydrogenase